MEAKKWQRPCAAETPRRLQRGPPPIKIRPQCGGTVVTFENASLGFSIIDVNGVPVVSEVSVSEGVEVGDRLVCVNGARLPRLPSWKVKALFESCGRPVCNRICEATDQRRFRARRRHATARPRRGLQDVP